MDMNAYASQPDHDRGVLFVYVLLSCTAWIHVCNWIDIGNYVLSSGIVS